MSAVVMPPDAPKDVVPWLYVIRSEFLPDDANLGRESDVRMRESLDWATSFVQAHRLCSPPEHYAAVAELIEALREIAEVTTPGDGVPNVYWINHRAHTALARCGGAA